MSRTAVSLAALTLAVILAGCSAFGGAAGPDTPETLTPAPVPTPTPAPPPGVTDTGLNPDRIGDVHAERLDATAYRVRAVRQLTADNTTVSSRTVRRWVGADGTQREFVARAQPGYATEVAIPRFYYFANDSVRLARAETAAGTVYWAGSDVPLGFGSDPTERDTIVRYLELFRGSITVGQATDRGVAVRGTELNLSWTADLGPVRRPHNETLTARIGPDGVVRSVRVSFDGRTAEGRTVHVVRETTIDRIGTATVRPPPWLADARTSGIYAGETPFEE